MLADSDPVFCEGSVGILLFSYKGQSLEPFQALVSLELRAAVSRVMLDPGSCCAFPLTNFCEERVRTFTNTWHNSIRWCIPVMPVVWEAEVAGLQI